MKPGLDVIFATYHGLPQGDPDDLLTLSLLEAKGLSVGVVDWRTVRPQGLDSRLVVLRSTWDYHQYYRQFLDWVDVAAKRTILKNSASHIHWNADKKYLLQLAQWGVATVPTVCLDQGKATDLAEADLVSLYTDFIAAGCEQIVVKPTVGLATSGVKCFSPAVGERPQVIAHIKDLGQTTDVLIQPYLKAVETYGERSLVFLDGKFSHAVRKAAFQKMAAAGGAGETEVQAEADEIAFGEKVLDVLRREKDMHDLLYARVDVVRDEQGQILLLELELIEPSLFLAMSPGAPERFARAIAALLD